MKRFLPVLIILACCILSCKSFDERLLTNKEKVDSGVKPMHVIVNYNSLTSCFKQNDISPGSPSSYHNFIAQSVNVIKNNLTFESESDNFYLSIMVRKSVWGMNNYGVYIIPTLLVPFGVPLESMSYTIELESAIMNSDGKVLKTYTATKTGSEYVALYWGYSENVASQTAIIKALESACKDIRTQLKNDIITINRITK